MTIPEIENVLKEITFPGATFHIKNSFNLHGSFVIQGAFNVWDSDIRTMRVTLYATNYEKTDHFPDRNSVIIYVKKMILRAMFHDAMENFRVNGAAPFHPHVAEAHRYAIDEDADRNAVRLRRHCRSS